MRPKLFRRLSVFGKKVPVFKVSGLLDKDTYGYYSEEHVQIGIDDQLSGEELEQTVIHEMFHAVLDRLHCQQQMAPEFLEVVIENLAAAVIENYKVKFKG